MDKILQKIFDKLKKETFLDQIANELSGSEFNSLMLEVFRRRAESLQPVKILKEFEENRFVQISSADPIRLREIELDWLRYAKEKGFEPLTLSPLSPFGSCSAVGPVNQNKIISSIRGTEVTADATNILAMKIALDFKGKSRSDDVVQYSTVHRHVRGQPLVAAHHTAHFSIFCLASGGFDKGGHSFLLAQLQKHFQFHHALIAKYFPGEELKVKFYLKSDDEQFARKLQAGNPWNELNCEFIPDRDNHYYQLVQFKIFIVNDGKEIDIADGGMVDWVQKLTGNKKIQTVISGAGLELVCKISTRDL